jgi:hypothetical protein
MLENRVLGFKALEFLTTRGRQNLGRVGDMFLTFFFKKIEADNMLSAP